MGMRGRYKNQILVKDIKIRSKGKTKAGKRRKGYTLDISADIPGVKGELRASVIGSAWVNDITSHIANQWERGIDLHGRQRTVSEATKRWRGYSKKVVMGEYTGREARKMKKYQSHYILRRVEKMDIPGTRRKKSRSIYSTFIPNPSSPALASSGLMVASLGAKFRAGRTYTSKGTGQKVSVASSFRLSVSANRADTALYKGGMDGNADLFNWSTSSGNFKQMFPSTSDLLNNALYWNNGKKLLGAITKALQVIDGALKAIPY